MTGIREVNPETDLEAITEIYRWYVENTTATFELDPLTPESMLRRIEEVAPNFPYLVWENEGEILGYCYVHTWKKYPAYDITLETTIYLRPEETGRGIGKKLMQRLIGECRESGYGSLIACITAENTRSCRFHENLGFRKVSHFHGVGMKFGRLLDVEDYQLIL